MRYTIVIYIFLCNSILAVAQVDPDRHSIAKYLLYNDTLLECVDNPTCNLEDNIIDDIEGNFSSYYRGNIECVDIYSVIRMESDPVERVVFFDNYELELIDKFDENSVYRMPNCIMNSFEKNEDVVIIAKLISVYVGIFNFLDNEEGNLYWDDVGQAGRLVFDNGIVSRDGQNSFDFSVI